MFRPHFLEDERPRLQNSSAFIRRRRAGSTQVIEVSKTSRKNRGRGAGSKEQGTGREMGSSKSCSAEMAPSPRAARIELSGRGAVRAPADSSRQTANGFSFKLPSRKEFVWSSLLATKVERSGPARQHPSKNPLQAGEVRVRVCAALAIPSRRRRGLCIHVYILCWNGPQAQNWPPCMAVVEVCNLGVSPGNRRGEPSSKWPAARCAAKTRAGNSAAATSPRSFAEGAGRQAQDDSATGRQDRAGRVGRFHGPADPGVHRGRRKIHPPHRQFQGGQGQEQVEEARRGLEGSRFTVAAELPRLSCVPSPGKGSFCTRQIRHELGAPGLLLGVSCDSISRGDVRESRRWHRRLDGVGRWREGKL